MRKKKKKKLKKNLYKEIKYQIKKVQKNKITIKKNNNNQNPFH